MGIALTIGITFLLFGFIGCMQEHGPSTFLDDIKPSSYVFIGVLVLINCLIHFLIA